MTSRRWCFTLNNYEFVPTLSDFDHATYVIYGEEVGDNGTPHLQGYVEFSQPVRRTAVTRAVPGAHVEVARGTPEQNYDYCSKDGVFTDEGTMSRGQGARNDLAEVRGRLDSGAPMLEIAEAHFSTFVRYHKGLNLYRTLKQTRRDWVPDVLIIVGPSGTGKTRTARDLAGADSFWKEQGKWWDGYDGQHTVVWDEFYGSHATFSFMLRLLDRYPLTVETKGGSVQFTSRRIIITSNQEPEDWYNSEATHQVTWAENPLNRRIQDFGRIMRTGEVHRRVRPRLNNPELYAPQNIWRNHDDPVLNNNNIDPLVREIIDLVDSDEVAPTQINPE